MMTKIPAGLRAGAIMADPGLAFEAYSAKGEGRSPQRHYRCQPFEQLVKLPVAEIAGADCFLFLWIPLRSVFLVEPLMCGWGFAFSGAGFAWAKQTKTASVGSWAVATAPVTTSKCVGWGDVGARDASRPQCVS
jgi:N6-adenosine-specific RNA methylase IME4